MTPLTHAAVGAALYKKLRPHPLTRILAFPLAFVSHYALDAVPHFEQTNVLLRYRDTPWIFLGLGLVGLAFAGLIWRWNRDAGCVWLLLCLWIGLGVHGTLLWRVLAAALILGFAAASRRRRAYVGYLAAGMLSLNADFFPGSWHTLRALHDAIHYHTDWGTLLYIRLVGPPLPAWNLRGSNPYFLAGWALELFVEGLVFLGAMYLLVRGPLREAKVDMQQPDVAGSHSPVSASKRIPS